MSCFLKNLKCIDVDVRAKAVVMKGNHQGRAINIDWNYCFICQRKQNTNITNTDEKLKIVASNITEFRNLGERDLEWDAIIEIIKLAFYI